LIGARLLTGGHGFGFNPHFSRNGFERVFLHNPETQFVKGFHKDSVTFLGKLRVF
jgi:hypothetical protein